MEVKTGFRIVMALTLGMAWLGLVFAGMAIAFMPSPHSRMIGWLLLIGAAAIMIATMNWWAKAFPAILCWGVMGGVLTIVEGHAVNHPEVLVTRLDATIMTLLFAASAGVSATFSRKPHLVHRVAMFCFVFCFFWQVANERMMLRALSIGFCALLFAWLYDWFARPRTGTRWTSPRRS